MTQLSMKVKLLIMSMSIKLHNNKKVILTQLLDKILPTLDGITDLSQNGEINKINGLHSQPLKVLL